MGKWTIEPHGDGFALYQGREPNRHGWNLLQITNVDTVRWDKVKPLIEAAPQLFEALQDVDECAVYWSEYDVPIGLHEKIKAALRAAGVNDA